MNNQTKKIISFIIIIATLPLLYGIGELFYELFSKEEYNTSGLVLITLKTLTGLLVTALIYIAYALLNLIANEFIMPILNKLFKDE
jgi:cytochrome c oxidase subunit IV